MQGCALRSNRIESIQSICIPYVAETHRLHSCASTHTLSTQSKQSNRQPCRIAVAAAVADGVEEEAAAAVAVAGVASDAAAAAAAVVV